VEAVGLGAHPVLVRVVIVVRFVQNVRGGRGWYAERAVVQADAKRREDVIYSLA
jgi:hypothetical protein